jgi:hypothetical protein
MLQDGTTVDLPITSGTFHYAGTTDTTLPTSIEAVGHDGQTLSTQDIDLNAGPGPGCTADDCSS